MTPFLICLTHAPAHAALDGLVWIRADLVLKISGVIRYGRRRSDVDAAGNLVPIDDPDRLLTEVSMLWGDQVKEIVVAESLDVVASLVNTRMMGPPQVFAMPCAAESSVRINMGGQAT